MPPKVDLTYLDGKSQWHIKSPCDLCVRIQRPPVNKVVQRPTTVSLGSISSIRIVNKGKNYTCIALSIQTGQRAFILYPEHWYVNTSGPLFSLPDVVCCMDPSKISTNSLQRMNNISSYFDSSILMCLFVFGYFCVHHLACLIFCICFDNNDNKDFWF